MQYLWRFDDNLNGLLPIKFARHNVRLFIIVIIIFFPVNITLQTGKIKKLRTHSNVSKVLYQNKFIIRHENTEYLYYIYFF